MNVSDIKSSDWALSLAEISEAVEGVDDINQCIGIILSTVKGSDPFRPTFGSDVWDFIDRPLPIAIANMKRAIREAIDLWEPRVIVTNVEHTYQNEAGTTDGVLAGMKFNISWKLKESFTTGTVEVNFGLYDKLIKSTQTEVPATPNANLTTEDGDPLLTEGGDNITI